ncbi:hypothetical protein [Streptomyces mirabilis]|uniref:hypothetical protein n=1 Tax=Streptomyces mirabilis TaxID=68239 RepID=UPI00332FD828
MSPASGPDAYCRVAAACRTSACASATAALRDEALDPQGFALAVLAAACAGTDVIRRIASLAPELPETPRAATLALSCALAADNDNDNDNDEAIAEALGETVRHSDYNPDAQGDPVEIREDSAGSPAAVRSPSQTAKS